MATVRMKRSKLDVINDLLEACLSRKPTNRVLREANVNHSEFRKIYEKIDGKNLLEMFENGTSKEYSTTEAGREYISVMKEIKEIMEKNHVYKDNGYKISVEAASKVLNACQYDESPNSLRIRTGGLLYGFVEKLDKIGLIDTVVLKDYGAKKSRKFKTNPDGMQLVILTNRLYDMVGEDFRR